MESQKISLLNSLFQKENEMRNYGSIKVNMSDMRKWKVTLDNVRFFDHIEINNGDFFALDTRPYVELLTDFGINFTTTFNGECR